MITGLWSFKKFSKSFKSKGTTKNPWEEDINNHKLCLYLPMGLVVSEQGHHSITNGEVKGVGEISIHKGSKHKIFEISGLYNKIKFDGENYISVETSTILGKAESFEFGCIFEIGRMLYENDVDFLGLKC